MTTRKLYIQQKFQFEISEISCAQWNGTFRLHRPDPSHRAFGYCSYKQDTKEQYWGDTILSNGKGHFGPTNWNDQTGQSEPPSKLVPSIPVRPNCNGWFHLIYQLKFPEFWVEWKAPTDSLMECWGVSMTCLDCNFHCFTIELSKSLQTFHKTVPISTLN